MAEMVAILFVIFFFTGFQISQSEPGYFIGLALVLALVNYFIEPLVKFFTLRMHFLTIWLFTFLIFMPLVYFISVFVPGISVKSGEFHSVSLGIFQINSFSMNEIVTVIISALIFGFMAAFMRWLIE